MQRYIPHLSPPTTCGRRHLALGNRRHTPSDWTRWTSNHRCHWKDSFGPTCWHTHQKKKPTEWWNETWTGGMAKYDEALCKLVWLTAKDQSRLCTLYNFTRWTVSPNSPTNCFNSCPARDIKCVTQTWSLQPVLIWFLPNTETVGSWETKNISQQKAVNIKYALDFHHQNVCWPSIQPHPGIGLNIDGKGCVSTTYNLQLKGIFSVSRFLKWPQSWGHMHRVEIWEFLWSFP